MKKILIILAAVLFTAGAVSARDRVYNSADPLPEAAKTMLKTHFPKLTVNHVKVDKDLTKTEYEAILSDGTEVDFNKDGEWKAIDRGHKAVPEAVILRPIREYVSSNYPGTAIVEIDKGRNDYEVTLANGVDLKFDRAGNFLRIDD